MATELAKAYVQIVPSARGIEGSISSVLGGESAKAGEDAGQSIASSLCGKLKSALVTLGIGKIVSDAIGNASEFETAMAKTSTLFSGSEEEFSALSNQILQLSSSYGVAATELAEAAYSAESASVPAEQLGAMLESSAKLAQAGFTDIDTALSATAKTMNAYGDAAMSADEIQKVLIQTQNLGITTVGELGASLANVTPTAAAMGVSFDQVGAAMAQMTAQGVPTAQATTQLRSAMSELGKAGTTADKSFRAAAAGTEYANMSFQEAISAGANLGDVFGLMQTYADNTGLSMVDLWGSVEAGNAAMMIASDVEKFNENLEAMGTDADVVGEAYGKMADTFGSSLDRLKESATNFMTTLFNGGDIAGSFDTMLANLGDVGEKLTGWLSTGLSTLGENLPAMMESLLDFGAGFLESLGNIDWLDLGVTIINGIIGAMGTLGERLIGLVSGALKMMTGEGGVEFGEIGTKILDGATSVLGTLGTTLSGLFGDALDLLTGDGGILSSFGSIGETILTAVSGVLNPDGENFLSKIFTSAESDIDGIDWEGLGDNVAKAGAALVNLTGEALAGGFTAAESIIKTINWEALGTTVGTVANGLVNLTGEALCAGFTAVESIINTIDWEGLGQVAGKAGNGLINLTGETLSAGFSAAESLINAIDWVGLGNTVGKVADNLIHLTGETLSGAFTSAEALINGINWEGLGATAASAANGLINLSSDAMSGAFTAAHATIAAIDWEGIGTTLGNIPNKLVEYTGETLAAPFEAAFGILKGIKWDEVGSAIQTGIGDVWSGLTSFLGGLLSGAGEAVEGVGSGIGTAAEGIGQAIANLFNGSDAKQSAEDLKQAMADLEQAIKDGKTNIETAAKEISTTIKTGLESDLSTENMKAIGKGAADDLVGSMNSEISVQQTYANIKIGQMRDSMRDKLIYADTWENAGKKMLASVRTGLTDNSADLDTKMETIRDSAVDTFSLSGWNDAGGSIVTGIIEGINANATSLYNTMRNLAYNALQAAQKALGIASPSKVMEEQVGKWIPEGIAAGIAKNEDAVTSAMAGISADLAGAAVSQGASLGAAAGSGAGSGDVVAAIQGLRNDLLNLKLLVGEKVFGEAVVDYGGNAMMDYIGGAESGAAYGYGT